MRKKEFHVGDVLEPVEYTSESGEVHLINLEEVQKETNTFFRLYWTVDQVLMLSIRRPTGSVDVRVSIAVSAFLVGSFLAGAVVCWL